MHSSIWYGWIVDRPNVKVKRKHIHPFPFLVNFVESLLGMMHYLDCSYGATVTSSALSKFDVKCDLWHTRAAKLNLIQFQCSTHLREVCPQKFSKRSLKNISDRKRKIAEIKAPLWPPLLFTTGVPRWVASRSKCTGAPARAQAMTLSPPGVTTTPSPSTWVRTTRPRAPA